MRPPLAPRRIIGELQDVLSSLIEHGIADDQNFPLLRQVAKSEWEVSFAGAEHISIVMDIDYADMYRELSEKRSYSVKLIDGGLLQMLYLFRGDLPVRHRLAYYPSPTLSPFESDPESYLRDELYIDIISRRIVPFPLRFDLDGAAARDVAHPHCHLTLGDVKCCRIPVSAPITPRWFVEFLLRNFYQTNRHDFVSGLPRHRLHFPSTLTKNEGRLIHVVIPDRAK